jgi:predicted AlkP superfamily pyrophosphatase or phosphodiesterase
MVLLVIDGLRRDAAERHLTTLSAIVRAGRGGYLPMTSLMPTNSRPSYNTISTGLPCPQNGIVDNHDNRLVSTPSIWSVARAHGLVTAASAFHWWSELYHHAPFRKDQDTHIVDGEGGFQYGFFYQRDGEIDPVVFAHALRLWDTQRPDLLLIHPCSVDWTGDYWGAADPAYAAAAGALNLQLPGLLEGLWTDRPETIVLVTSDHGMSDIRGHGWDAPELRRVFFFALGDGIRLHNVADATSLDIAPTVLALLGLPVPEAMTGRRLCTLA